MNRAIPWEGTAPEPDRIDPTLALEPVHGVRGRRRRGRRRHLSETPQPPARSRRGKYLLALLALGLAAVAIAPSVWVRSPLARPFIQRQLSARGFQGNYQTLRFGWLAPVRASGIELVGATAGTKLLVEQLDCDVSLLQALTGLGDPIRLSVRGVKLELSVRENASSLETDLSAVSGGGPAGPLGSGVGGGAVPNVSVDFQNLSVLVTDVAQRETWGIDQGRGSANWFAGKLTAECSGILSDPRSGSGSIDASVKIDPRDLTTSEVDMKLKGLPLRVASLVRLRFGELAGKVPQSLTGDATGAIRLVGSSGGNWSVEAERFELRNLVASDPMLGPQVWRNELAVVDGLATLQPAGMTGRGFRLATDFAELTLDGTFVAPSTRRSGVDPLVWLGSLDGTAAASVDLPLLNQRLPGFLPLRQGAELIAGRVIGEISTTVDPRQPSAGRLVSAAVRSDPIRARREGAIWVVEPASLVATLRIDPAGGRWRADRCELTSAFGTAALEGELARGQGNANLDLGRLATAIEPLVDLPDFRLGGVASGQVAWAAEADERWTLHADGEATDLTLLLPGGIRLHRPTLAVKADLAGRVEAAQLAELSNAELSLRSTSLEADAVLMRAVADPSMKSALPLRMSSRGRLEVLAEFLGPWLPESLHGVQGGYDARVDAEVGLAAGQLATVALRLEEPRGGWNDQYFAQHQLGIDFEGRFDWPSANLLADSLTITSESLSAVAKGEISDEQADFEFAWRASLEPLTGSFQSRLANQPWPTGGRLASTRPATPPGEGLAWRGFCEGNGTLRRNRGENKWVVTNVAQGSGVEVLQGGAGVGNQNATPGSLLWGEPNIQCEGTVTYDLVSGGVVSDKFQIRSEWLASTLAGQVRWDAAEGSVRVGGPTRIDMTQLARRLTTLLGTPIRLEGMHETPLDLNVSRIGAGPVRLKAISSIGWEGGEIAGLRLGPASVPITLSEESLTIEPATIPIEQGQIDVAADLRYSPGPPVLDVRPGSKAKNLRLTRELSDRWMQYLAPLMARATTVEGNFGIELAEARVDLSYPERSKVRGQLQVGEIRFDAGPVSQQVIGGVQQIRMLSRGRSAADIQAENVARAQPINLVTIPTQSVDFDMTDGVITHQRMFMDIDRARLVTSGQVSVDGRLNLITQVPLDASWLGSDLKSLAGATVTLPISGSLSQPQLDTAAIRNMATQLGAQAIQKTAESYLEEQLNRGLEKLLGK